MTYDKSPILICDPSPHMANIIAGMARTLGLRNIFEAYDMRAARSALSLRRFGLVLLNDYLGKDDTIALLRALRADPDHINRTVSVIMMSSAPDKDLIAAARDAGVNEFLRKPFAVNHLQSRLTALEAHPRTFIVSESYCGPDRRRRTEAFDGEDRRHANPG